MHYKQIRSLIDKSKNTQSQTENANQNDAYGYKDIKFRAAIIVQDFWRHHRNEFFRRKEERYKNKKKLELKWELPVWDEILFNEQIKLRSELEDKEKEIYKKEYKKIHLNDIHCNYDYDILNDAWNQEMIDRMDKK